jgi:hypothetical protein
VVADLLDQAEALAGDVLTTAAATS